MKKKLLKIFLGFITFFFYILVAEACLQIHDLYLNLRYGQTNVERFLHEYDEIRGWRNKKNTSAFFVVKEDRIKSHVSINSKGLRGPEYDYEKPKGIKRVLLLGDSITAGFEVSQDQTVAHYLETKLNENGNWQVINGGTRGYGTDQNYLFLIQEGFRYQPDIIIYLFADNDLENNLTAHVHKKLYGKSYFTVGSDGELYPAGIPVPSHFDPNEKTKMTHPTAQEYFDRIERSGEKMLLKSTSFAKKQFFIFHQIKTFLFEHSLVYQFTTKQLKRSEHIREVLFRLGLTQFGNSPAHPKEMVEAEWQITEKLIVKMKYFSESINAKFAVFEVVNSFKEAKPARKLKLIFKKHGIRHIQSHDAFLKKVRQGRKLHWKDNIHWTAEGHTLAATIIQEYLIENKWL